MTPLFTLQVALLTAPTIAALIFAWWAIEARSALRAALWSNKMLAGALAQADVDAQARACR